VAAAKTTSPKKATPAKKTVTAKKAVTPVKKTAAKKTAVKKAATKKAIAPVKKTVAKKTAVKKAVAPAKKVSAVKKPPVPAKKVVAKKAIAKKTVAKKTSAPAKKVTAAKKAAAPAKKAAAAKKVTAPAKKTAVTKTPAKKTVAKKTAVKKAAATKTVTPRRPRAATVKADAPTVTVQNVAASVVVEPAPETTRWRGRPIAGNAVRAVAVSVPLASSIVSGVVLSHLIPRPSAAAAVVGWWLLIMALSTVVLVAVDRVARRVLPLATLLKLAMAFPDEAPSRFKVAARAGTTRSLEQQLQRAEQEGIDDGPAQAARRILTLVGALGAHDRRTRGHSERVRAFNDLIAQEMRLPQHDRDRLRWAALLHDIGKLHVPTRILNKPKKPTEKEWEILKSHPARGARIAAPLASWLGEWAPTIEQHHERWDGGGYPHGLAGNDICLGARIVAVADAYEVMTAPRPYSRPVSAAAAREELARCADAQFDPEIVRAFLNISIGKLRKVIGPISWLAQLPLLGATPKLEAAVGMAGRQVVSVAATATGTGVLAAAMLPNAVHHHGHHHVDHFSTLSAAGTYSAPSSHHAAPAPHTAAKPDVKAAPPAHVHTHKTSPKAAPATATPGLPDTAPQAAPAAQAPVPGPQAHQPTNLPPANRPAPPRPVPTTPPPTSTGGQQQQPAPAPAPQQSSEAPAPHESKPPKDDPAPKPVETKSPKPSEDDKKAQEAADKAAKEAAEAARKAQEAADKAAKQAAEEAKKGDPHPEHGTDHQH